MASKPQNPRPSGRPGYIGDSMPSEVLKTTLTRPPVQQAPAKPATTPMPAQPNKGGK